MKNSSFRFPRCILGNVCLLCIGLLVSGGCDHSGYPSSTVRGRITIDGKAVPKGHILFSPNSGTHGPVRSTEISNGEYRCEKVSQGKVHVTFIAQAAKPKILFDVVNKVNREVPDDILPPACQQGQDAEITPGENQLDFNLKNE
jgi:hypothetical protein